MENKTSIGAKLAGTLFLLVFAIGFSWFGFAMAVPALSDMVGKWYQARAYVAVPATVRSTGLTVSRGDTNTEKVEASFAYRYQDRDYTSDRVGTSALSDNFDSVHRTVHERLRQAQASGTQVTLWVDPAEPGRALYDRSLRWKPLLFMVPFATLFPAVGIGAWLLIGYVWLGRHGRGGARGAGVREHQSSPGRYAALAMTCVSLFWNLLSWPISLLLLVDWHSGDSLLGLLVLLFPAAGLAMVWMTLTLWRTRWRTGTPMFELMQAPDLRGRFPLRGRLHFTPGFALRTAPAQAAHPLRLMVKLVQSVESGEDTVVTTLWERCVLDAVLARGAASVDFSATLPAEWLGAEPRASAQLEWKLEMAAMGARIEFDLPAAARD